jgi:hypothetical protein
MPSMVARKGSTLQICSGWVWMLVVAAQMHAATVAYWRFEEGPADGLVVHAGADGAFHGTVRDGSGNGNHLSAWTQGGYAGFAYRTNVASGRVPQFGWTNRFSVQNTGNYPAMFTSAQHSRPSGINLDAILPVQFTVEASYRAVASGGYRTVVGRDARNVSRSDPNLAAFYLQVRPDDSVAVVFTDVSGYTHRAFSPPGWVYGISPGGAEAPWYHLAAVSDGNTLKLYVNNLLVASTDLVASGSPNRALVRGSGTGPDWVAGAWSVGRGLYAGVHTDRAYGFIDEVRISDRALEPGEFLFAPRPVASMGGVVAGSVSLEVAHGPPGMSFQVLHTTDARLPWSRWSNLGTHAFDAQGRAVVRVTGLPVELPHFYAIRTAVVPPPPGPLTYSLAPGWQNWPADIRERIVYAMEGAVAQYNKWGTFRKHLTVNYNPGVPTAQASYSGWIDFGGQIGYRTALHEISHTLGVGTTWQWQANLAGGVWQGPHGRQKIQEFDGPGAVIYSDGTHFWPYGLNYDNEASTESIRRHVLLVEAFRKDMGLE